MFDNALLSEARVEARRLGLKLPTGICALKVGRQQYAVQANAPHNYDHYESASSVSEAKAKWIYRLIDRALEGPCDTCNHEHGQHMDGSCRATAGCDQHLCGCKKFVPVPADEVDILAYQ